MRRTETLLSGLAVWRLRGLTLMAMALLCAAVLAVKLVPFRYWRGTLGRPGPADALAEPGTAGPARRIAAHVERAACRLPFATKCLPRAMVLCWLLRRAGIAYVFKIAARPMAARNAGDDALHAWVESGNTTIIGSLPGPWATVLTLVN